LLSSTKRAMFRKTEWRPASTGNGSFSGLKKPKQQKRSFGVRLTRIEKNKRRDEGTFRNQGHTPGHAWGKKKSERNAPKIAKKRKSRGRTVDLRCLIESGP